MKYPKINNLFVREGKKLTGIYSDTVFANISHWLLTEKIDGTNIRIIFEKERQKLYDGSGWTSNSLTFKGRTDDAQIPKPLLKYLDKTFTLEQFKKQFPEANKVVLFGEGYGNKIQKVGKKYRKDNSFRLFDAWIDGWWLEFDKIKILAGQLGIKSTVWIDIMTKEMAINYLKQQPKSKIAEQDLIMEGVVARTFPMVLFRDGTPVMWKLKVKDVR